MLTNENIYYQLWEIIHMFWKWLKSSHFCEYKDLFNFFLSKLSISFPKAQDLITYSSPRFIELRQKLDRLWNSPVQSFTVHLRSWTPIFFEWNEETCFCNFEICFELGFSKYPARQSKEFKRELWTSLISKY